MAECGPRRRALGWWELPARNLGRRPLGRVLQLGRDLLPDGLGPPFEKGQVGPSLLLRDVGRERTRRITRTTAFDYDPDGLLSGVPVCELSLSGDGRYLAYVDERPVGKRLEGERRRIRLYDRVTGRKRTIGRLARVDLEYAGGLPAVSLDGTVVTFGSTVRLTRSDRDREMDIYRYDIRTRRRSLVTRSDRLKECRRGSAVSAGGRHVTFFCRPASDPSLLADGRRILFGSNDFSLHPQGAALGATSHFLDRDDGALHPISSPELPDGTTDGGFPTSLSANGRWVGLVAFSPPRTRGPYVSGPDAYRSGPWP